MHYRHAGVALILLALFGPGCLELIHPRNSTATAAALTVISVTPNSGSADGGTSVVILGTGFGTVALASISNALCASAVQVSSSEIDCVTAPNRGGTFDVTVQNSSTDTATLTAGYTYTMAATWVGATASGATSGWLPPDPAAPVSGTGDGMLDNPSSVALDTSAGFFYVSDGNNNRIVKYNLTTGAFVGWTGRIQTTGGTCIAGAGVFSGGWCAGGVSDQSGVGMADGEVIQPTAIAVDPTNGYFYVADGNYRIQRFHLDAGTPAGWIGEIGTTGGTCTAGVNQFTGGWCMGGTSRYGTMDGTFYYPTGLAVDPVGGYLYVADGGNNRVQRINLASGTPAGWIGMIQTTGGTCTAGAGQFTGGWCSGGVSDQSGVGHGDGMMIYPNGVAVDHAGGYLFVADLNNNRVQRFNLSSGAFAGWIGKIATTGGTCTAGVGQFTGGWCSGGTSATGTGDGMLNPAGVAVSAEGGYLYVADGSNNRVQRFDLASGAFAGWVGGIGTPGGTCTAGVGQFTGSWCSGGAPLTPAGTGIGIMDYPNALAVDWVSGYLYVADWNGNRIHRITPP